MNMNDELILINEVLNNQTEAENNGVKYIYMDENTIYRFENNKMKKISSAMIKRAKKLTNKPKKQLTKTNISDDDEENEPIDEPVIKPKKKLTKKQLIDYENNDDDDESEPIDEPVIKPKKQLTKKQLIKSTTPNENNIDLNEYWQTKSKLDYQQLELERYKNKVNKLKHYKLIVNKLTGGEYDNTNNQPQTIVNEPINRVNDNLFIY